VLDTTGGTETIDADGDFVAETPSKLDSLGITSGD